MSMVWRGARGGAEAELDITEMCLEVVGFSDYHKDGGCGGAVGFD
jgi:hypothetical protein